MFYSFFTGPRGWRGARRSRDQYP